jgi:hypothetical protein
MDILLLTFLFVVKHFLFDYVWQTQEEINYKGTYLDWRGVTHSVKHGTGTGIVLLVSGAGIEFAWLYIALDFLIHYHIDWLKMNASRNLTPADRAFWIWLGFDQTLHYLTYIMFIAIMIS